MKKRALLRLPPHQEPDPNRVASAPYNFIPLPETIVTAVDTADDLPDHDHYDLERHTGYFDVTLTTLSPVYVRCPISLADFLRQERGEDEGLPYRQQVKNTPHSFYTRNENQPVIPGSSLRGMLRHLLEIVSYGKVQWVTDKRLFYRTVDNSALGQNYRGKLTAGSGTNGDGYRSKVHAGIWHVNPRDGSCRIEKCSIARVEMQDVADVFSKGDINALYEGGATHPNGRPKWDYQHRPVWVQLEPSETDHPHSQGRYLRYRKVTSIRSQRSPGYLQGTLVLTGPMQHKHMASVYLNQNPPTFIDVPNEAIEEDLNKRLVDRFHDDDQISRWQRLAFPNGKPRGAQRERDGYLRDGEPVFFLEENGSLIFFGRAQMFRLPYRQRPIDLVPRELRDPNDIDFAEAIFGFVRSRQELDEMKKPNEPEPPQGSKARAYASRVFVTEAALEPEQTDIWFSEKPITPKILATPNPTAFQHYLTQQEPNNKDRLDHYDSPPYHETKIRGHKQYWHQGRREVDDIEDKGAREDSTQHTRFKPVNANKRFKFRIYFENLSDEELGALCWVLHPLGDSAKQYRHNLGMGKPLGMGAVKLDARLCVCQRVNRYNKLFEGNNWQTGNPGQEEDLSVRTVLENRTMTFEQKVLENLEMFPQHRRLYELRRVALLLKMLEWPGYKPDLPPRTDNRVLSENGKLRPNTRNMQIQLEQGGRRVNEFRERFVLPSPAFGREEELTGQAEPELPPQDEKTEN